MLSRFITSFPLAVPGESSYVGCLLQLLQKRVINIVECPGHDRKNKAGEVLLPLCLIFR